MAEVIDLRSDTVTRPTPEMRRVMAEAAVGDDVFGEDPSVNALEDKAAGLLDREAALFVPSGTMANQIALKVLTSPGDEVLLDAGSHPFNFESGAAAVISSVQLRTLPGRRGLLEPEQIEAAVRPDDPHFPPTRLVCLENTHNRGGGSVYPVASVAAIRKVAEGHGLKMHLDGARLFNACLATGAKPSEYAGYFETVSFCPSKGLGAPVGSLVVSDRETIKKARRWRKLLGGGMRQAGILAAAGLYALDHHLERLAEDHENAQILARGLAGLDAPELTARLKKRGVLVLAVSPDSIRTVTHLDVDRAGIQRALGVMAEALKE